ncbi:Phage tail protein P2_I [Photorhabdus australis subsp. thailandensis]|uniref:Phage tail protein P2_I n=1 Tax=Photorhabdus australis subsp. thailandensis TaxID=2805096 RepID=A0A1C0U983_9GAMM|nr:phage tail protein I [Photorhabdus australis]OCQ54498.1 Phage tail protein P2_I [Photorhabdus australis subsp. thailandensis]
MNDRLLPTGSTVLELAAAKACSQLQNIEVRRLRKLWNPDTCPSEFLPYLAWAWSVDRWDEYWPVNTKRDVIKNSMFLHKHKGTIGAVRRVVEPLGYLIQIKEWWENNETPGTFRLAIGVQENGITEETFLELERLISDAKPVSRHLIGLSINLDVKGEFYCAATSYTGDDLTVYQYLPDVITTSDNAPLGAAIHLIDTDTLRVSP